MVEDIVNFILDYDKPFSITEMIELLHNNNFKNDNTIMAVLLELQNAEVIKCEESQDKVLVYYTQKCVNKILEDYVRKFMNFKNIDEKNFEDILNSLKEASNTTILDKEKTR